MNWIPLISEDQLEHITQQSYNKPQLLFKHSVRCGVSSMVKNRLDKQKQPEGIDFYYLDLIRYRGVSNTIASKFGIHHESPQVLMIKEGKCVYDESHMGISMDEIEAEAM